MAASEEQLIVIEAGHQIDLIRFGSSVGAKVNPHLTTISKYAREVLLQYDTIPTKKLMNEITAKIVAKMEKELGAFTDEAEKDLKALVSEEIGFQYDVVKGAVGKGVAVARPTIAATTSLINNTPMVLNGKAFSVSEYVGDYTPNQIEAVKRVIVSGWSDGQTTRQISQSITGTKQVKGVLQASQRSAYMMAKDVTSHISTASKTKVGKENNDLIVGEKAVVTLDSKTSPICQKIGSRDSGGQEWYYATDGYNFPRSPYHNFCRTTMTFIMAPEYREIADQDLTRPAIIDGEAVQVPAETSWMDLAKRNPTFAEQSLGKSKAKVLDSMSAKEFTDTAYNRMGDPLTLNEMKASNSKVTAILDD